MTLHELKQQVDELLASYPGALDTNVESIGINDKGGWRYAEVITHESAAGFTNPYDAMDRLQRMLDFSVHKPDPRLVPPHLVPPEVPVEFPQVGGSSLP